MGQKGFTIDFKTINDHTIDEFRSRFGEIIYKEIKKKKISTCDLQRQLNSLGYGHPIYRVLKNDNIVPFPFEIYLLLLVLVGVDLYMIPNETVNNSRKNIKNRIRLTKKVSA